MRVVASVISLGAATLRSTALRSTAATQKQKDSHHKCYTSCHTRLLNWFNDGKKVIRNSDGVKEPIKEKSMVNHICRMVCWKIVHKPTWKELSNKRTNAFARCFTYKTPELCEEQQDDEGLCRWSVDEEIEGVFVPGLKFCVPAIKSNAEAFCVAANHPLHRKWERKCREHFTLLRKDSLPDECKFKDNATNAASIDEDWRAGCGSQVPGCAEGKDVRANPQCTNTQVHFHLYNTVVMCHYTMRNQRRTAYICNKFEDVGTWDGVWNIKFPAVSR